MKFFLALGFLFLSISTMWSQGNRRESNYFITAGVNALDNGGSILPFDGTISFNSPFFIAGEYRFKSNWSTALTISTNTLTVANKDQSYFSVDASGIYNFDENFFKTDRITLYVGVGLGNYTIANKGYSTSNFTGGARYWFSNAYGIQLQSTAKVRLSAANQYNTSHYQYSLGLVWRN